MASQASPVTGIIEEAEVIIDFGRYEGRTVREISSADPLFYQELVQQKEAGFFSIRRHRDKSFRLYMNPLSTADN